MQKKSMKQKIFVTLLGFLLCIILLEIGIRLGGFILLSMQEHRNKPSIKQKDSYKILCLGDSMTAFGYPKLLEEILNNRVKGVAFKVIDKAKPGTNSEFVISTLKKNLDKYNPNMVIVMMGFNDEVHLLPYGKIPTSKETLFKTYKLAKILWYHMLNKIKELGIFSVGEREQHGKVEKEVLGRRGYPKEAAAKKNRYRENMKVASGNSIARYIELGCRYMDQRDFTRAKEFFKKVLEINPENNKARIRLGWCCINQMNLIEAEIVFKKAIEVDPKNFDAYIGLGVRYRYQGMHDKAEKMFKKSLEINPGNDKLYLELGWWYIEQDKYNNAIQMFKKSLEINRENDVAYIGLGE